MYRRVLVGLFVSVFILSLLLTPRAAFAKEACFIDKSPYCFVGIFALYWTDNGGLPVFGYPITLALDEANATGQRYVTQWAERNRFEVHPENAGTPYEILLGLLGKDRLAQLGRDPNTEPRESGPKDGCLWFEQTGHNVCNQGNSLGFKTYWESHGLKIAGLDKYSQSLQLFGLPLTEPKQETNSSGDSVITQWFERARFEWHPGNPDEYKVLLGLLGSELRGNAPAPTPLNPADCADVPESISASITPKKCFLQGTAITFEFRGFQAGEPLLMWDVAENGEFTTVTTQVANAEGRLRGSFVATDETNGFWQWSVEGTASKHQATIYFRQTPTTPPPPPPPPPPPTVSPNCNRATSGAPNAPIRIVGLNKSAETVTIRNVSGAAVNVEGWWICSLTGNQLHAVLSGSIGSGQTITVNSQASGNIWNNSSNDDAALFDAQGNVASFWDD